MQFCEEGMSNRAASHGTGGDQCLVSNAGNARGATFVGSKNKDSIVGGTATRIMTGGLGDDVLTGGLGVDRFVVDAVTDLGLGGVDQLAASAGATGSVTLAAAWVASRSSSNSDVVNLKAAGFDADVTAVLGSTGWNLSVYQHRSGTPCQA
jgi:Ca2+-binding RTX toxin-like protein